MLDPLRILHLDKFELFYHLHHYLGLHASGAEFGITQLKAQVDSLDSVSVAAGSMAMLATCAGLQAGPVPVPPEHQVCESGCTVYCSRLSMQDGGELMATEYVWLEPSYSFPAYETEVVIADIAEHERGSCVAYEITGSSRKRPPSLAWCRAGESLGFGDGPLGMHTLEPFIKGVYSSNVGPSLPAALFASRERGFAVVNRFHGPDQMRCIAEIGDDAAFSTTRQCTRGPPLGLF